MHKFFGMLLLATVAGALTFSAAATMPVTSDDLTVGFFSGVQLVQPCDVDGIDVSYELLSGDAQMVRSVTVTGGNTCESGTIVATLVDADDVTIATAVAVLSSAAQQTLDLDVAVSAEAIDVVSITLAE